jgi:hypothetical protein
MKPDDQMLDWAYDFECDLSLEEILDRFNQLGPWRWQLRDNYIEGHYINTRPADGVHLKLREYPQAFIKGPREAGFSAIIRLSGPAVSSRGEIDSRFTSLLSQIEAKDLQSVEADD